MEVIFSDACLKFIKKEDSNKDQVIIDLRKEIEELKKLNEEERERLKKEKLKGYTNIIKNSSIKQG